MAISYATSQEYYDWRKVNRTQGSQESQHKADLTLSIILDAASRAIEICTDTYFYTYPATLHVKRNVGDPREMIRIPYFQSLSEVENSNGTILDDTEYSMYKEKPDYPYCRVINKTGYWSASRYSSFKGIYGFNYIPSNIKLATLLISSKLYNRPHTPSGIEGGSLFIARSDPDVQRLLIDYMDNIVGSNRVIQLVGESA